MHVHGYRSNTRNKVKRQGCMKQYRAPEKDSAKKIKRGKLAQEQSVRKTNNRSGASHFSEIRSSVKFRDFDQDF